MSPSTSVRARVKSAADIVNYSAFLCMLIFLSAELELTVSLLVQIDKLVMLIESPVFTSTHI